MKIKAREILIVLVLFIVGGCTAAPKGTSIKGKVHRMEDVEFVRDLTYQKNGEQIVDQEIADKSIEIINSAKNYVIVDVFLFNGLVSRGSDMPKVAERIVEALIAKKREGVPVYVISDEVNSFYGSYNVEEFDAMRKEGIPVIITDTSKIKDSIISYSFLWRHIFSHFGTGDEGWLQNPFADQGQKVNVRSYLKLVNIKANHRKVIIGDSKALVSSANFHNDSGNHSNIAVYVDGSITKEILQSEIDTAYLSGYNIILDKSDVLYKEGKPIYEVRLLTEAEIGESIIDLIDRSKEGEIIRIGIFYLGDRKMIKALKKAAKRKVKIELIMDSNVEAFGRSKVGVPNKQVALELMKKGRGQINIRWYNTNKEQYHSKFIYRVSGDEMEFIGGSANFTKRNLFGYNFESDLYVKSKRDSEFSKKVEEYYDNLWNNKGGDFTVPYKEREDTSYFKYILYRSEEGTGVGSF